MLKDYPAHVAERAALGIPPLPLSAPQTAELIELLKNPPKGEEQALLDLLAYRVPAGVDSGTRLRVRGEGEPGVHGGPPGDLYVVLTVEQDKRWRRQGQDLVFTQEVSFVQAALGHRVEIPGLEKPIPLDVPKGVQSGAVLRVPGEGMPYPGRRQRGDMLVEVRVLTPTRLSDRQVELLREFEAAGEQTPLQKVKKAAKKISKAMGLD